MSDSSIKVAEVISQGTPAVAVSSAVVLGYPLSDWVYVVTIIYTFIGICSMIKKHWVDPWKAEKKKGSDEK